MDFDGEEIGISKTVRITFYFRCVSACLMLVVWPPKPVHAANPEKGGLLALAPATTNRMQVGSLARAIELVQQGKEAEALRLCDELIRKGGVETHDALRQKGLCLYRLRRYSDACSCWEYMLRAYRAQSKDDDIILKLAQTYAFSLRRPDKAEQYYQQLINRMPPSKLRLEAQYQYAGVRYEAKDYTNAMALFREHLRDFPESGYAMKVNGYIGICEKAIKAQALVEKRDKVKADEPVPPTPVATESRSRREFQEAEVLFARKLYKEAIKTYQLVRNDAFCRERDAAVYRMGQCYSELGKDEEAIRHWEVSAQQGSRETNTFYAVQSLKAIGDTYIDKLAVAESAEKYYRKLVASYPDDPIVPAVLKKIGIIYLYEGRDQEAKQVFEQLQPRTPPDPNAPPTGLDRLLRIATEKRMSWLPDMKITARANKAAQQIKLGDLYFTAMEYERAVQAYERAERIARGTEEAAYALMQAGRCHNQMYEHRKALACYAEFLDRYQRSQWADDALVRAGIIYVGPLADYAQGEKMYRTALKLQPVGNMADVALYHLATLAYWKKEWRQARLLLVDYLQQYPRGRFAQYVIEHRLPEIEAEIARTRKTVVGKPVKAG